MNDITFAGDINGGGEAFKGFAVVCCAKSGALSAPSASLPFSAGDVAVVPPLTKYTASGNNTTIVLERALLPVKKIEIIPASKAADLTDACRKAVKYFNGDEKAAFVSSALGNLIAAYISDFSNSGGYSPVVSTVMSDIDKHLSDSRYSLEDFARSLPLNYDYIRKLFKKEVGITPHEYLTLSRMELAKSIILSGVANQYSNYTVAQIAEMCGYAEPLYFSRVFKKHFGVAPGGYGGGK